MFMMQSPLCKNLLTPNLRFIHQIWTGGIMLRQSNLTKSRIQPNCDPLLEKVDALSIWNISQGDDVIAKRDLWHG